MESTGLSLSELAHNHTSSTININTDLEYLTGILSVITYTVLAVVMLLYSKGDESFPLGMNMNSSIFFSTAFVALLANLSIKTGTFHDIYIVAVVVVVGTILNIYGSQTFFKSPERNDRVLGDKDATIRYIMLGVTLPMCLIELLVSVMSARDNPLHSAEIMTCTLQKLLQTGIFHFSVSRRTPNESKLCGASWYAKAMGLFNFSMWLQVIADGTVISDVSLESTIGESGSSLVSGLYTSLLVDYRLLCAMLYFEYGAAIDNWKNPEDGEEDGIPSNHLGRSVRMHTSQYEGLGYMLGVLVFLCQFITLLLSLQKRPIGLWVNIFSIGADLLVIIPGVMLIRFAKVDDSVAQKGGKKASGMEMMVVSMGLVGLVYWSLKACVSFIITVRMHDEEVFSHLAWITVITVTRIVGIPFQIFFFVRITPTFCLQEKVRDNKLTYLLVPCVLFGLLSVFVNTVINSHR